MNWNEFYEIVIEDKKNGWRIMKQPCDKSVFLIKDNITWIMNNPFEQNAYNAKAQGVKGKVLMAGLGIGYDALMIADESELTIIEKEQDVIDLATKYIKHPNIKIINDKILNYMQTTHKKFDYVYLDIFPDEPCMFPEEVKILTDASRMISPKIVFWRKYRPLDL